MFRRFARTTGRVLTCAVAFTVAIGVFSAADARRRDPDVSPPLQGTDVAAVCGDRTLLAGPADAPAGAVVVDAADSLQAAVNAHPEGTTFYLPGARYVLAGAVTPRSRDTFIGGPDTVIDGGGVTTSAFKAGREFGTPWVMADDVTLRFLTVQHFDAVDDQVVVNADAGDGWTLDRVTVADNHGGAVMMGSRTSITSSCLTRNGQYGFNTYRCRGYGPTGCTTSTTVTDLLIDRSEISYNDTEQLAITNPNCGCSGGGKFWDVRGARVTGNWVHHNNSVGLWADTNNADFLFEGNVIEDNDAAGLMYEISYSARVVGNTFRRNAIGQGSRRLADGPGDYFPDGAVYISESGGDAAALAADRARGESWTPVNADPDTLEIADNTFVDNWNGVVLWESADRYCSSVANTSTNYCTLRLGSYDHSGATLLPCVAVPQGDALDTCRWKTRNVDVHNNLFSIDRAAVGHGCADGDDHCGRNAIFSQWGVFPAYPAETVQRAVLFGQNNEFHHNVYVGTWRFTAFDQAPTSIRSITTWSAMAPGDAQTAYRLWNDPPDGLGQDDGSVHRPLPVPPPPPTTTTSTTAPPEATTTTGPDGPTTTGDVTTSTTVPGPTTTTTTAGPPAPTTTTTTTTTTAPPATTTTTAGPPATTTTTTSAGPPATTTTTTEPVAMAAPGAAAAQG